MGYIDKGRICFQMQSLQLRAHFHAQLGIQIGQGLVHKQSLGARSQGSCNGHTLLLTTTELARITPGVFANLQHGHELSCSSLDLFLFPFQVFQAKGNVFIHRHMGPQSVVLEQKAHTTLFRRHINALFRGENHFIINGNLTTGRSLKACNHAQGSGLAAA